MVTLPTSNISRSTNDVETASEREPFAPVVNSEEVERAVELYHVRREENVVASRQSVSFVHVPRTQQRSGGEAARDDNVLSRVQHAQRRIVPPFHFLHRHMRSARTQFDCYSQAVTKENNNNLLQMLSRNYQ